MKTERHQIDTSPSGLWVLTYVENEKGAALIFSAPSAKMWRFHLTDEGTLAHFREIAEAFDQVATAADLLWLANCLACAEAWFETIPYDLVTYGEIGVSF